MLDKWKQSALHEGGYVDVAKVLIHNGADVDAVKKIDASVVAQR